MVAMIRHVNAFIYIACSFLWLCTVSATPPNQILYLTNRNITLKSPGYDQGQYPKNTKQSWEFSADPAKYIRVMFTDFQVESHPSCVWDFVSIYSGQCPGGEATLVVRLCGEKPNYNVTVQHNSACVKFVSDRMITKKGFAGLVTSVEVPEKSSSISSTTDTLSTASPAGSAESPAAINTASSPTVSPAAINTASSPTVSPAATNTASSPTVSPAATNTASSPTVSPAATNTASSPTVSPAATNTASSPTIPSSSSTSLSSVSSSVSSSSSTVTSSAVSASTTSSSSPTDTSSSTSSSSVSSPISSSYSSSVSPEMSPSISASMASSSKPIEKASTESSTMDTSVTSNKLPGTTITNSQVSTVTVSLSTPIPGTPDSITNAETSTLNVLSSAPTTPITSGTLTPQPTDGKSTHSSTTLDAASLSTLILDKTTPTSSEPSTTTENVTTQDNHIPQSVKPLTAVNVTMCEDNDVDVADGIDAVITTQRDSSGNYDMNSHCIMTINNTNKLNISLQFKHFDVEYNYRCVWDYVTIETNVTSGKLCGTTLPATVYTEWHLITVLFHSDHIVSRSGFILHVRARSNSQEPITSSAAPTLTTPPDQTSISSSKSISTSTSPTGTSSILTPPPSKSEHSVSTVQMHSSSVPASSTSSPIHIISSELPLSSSVVVPPSPSKPIALPSSTSSTVHLTTATIQTFSGSSSFETTISSTTVSPSTKQSPSTDVRPVLNICETQNLPLSRTTTLVTPGYVNGEKYPINVSCTFHVSIPQTMKVSVTMESFEVEKSYFCSWDYLRVRVGATDVKLCGFVEYSPQLGKTNTCGGSYITAYDMVKKSQVCFLDNDEAFVVSGHTDFSLTFNSDFIIPKKGFNITLRVHPASALSSSSSPSSSSLKPPSSSSSSLLSSSSLSSSSSSSSSSSPPPSSSSPPPSPSSSSSSSSSSSLSSPQPPSSSPSSPPSSSSSSPPPPSSLSSSSSSSSPPPSSSSSSPLSSSSPSPSSPLLASFSSSLSSSSSSSSTSTTLSTPSTTESETSSVLPQACSSEGQPYSLTDESGYIESPGYQKMSSYPPNTLCKWKIQDDKNKVILLIFESFDVELSSNCRWDKLAIYERAGNGSDYRQLAVLCGNKLPHTLTSVRDVLIEFKSDTIQQKRGFKLRYIKTETQGTPGDVVCAAAMIPCLSSGTCIPIEWMCDGDVDCAGGDDEKACSVCKEHEFRCGNGVCLRMERRCDGIPQCAYAEDEYGCVYIDSSGTSPGTLSIMLNGLPHPLCHSDGLIGRADDMCKAAGYRSFTTLWSAPTSPSVVHAVIKSDSVNSGQLRFNLKDTCPSMQRTHITCSGSDCGVKHVSIRRKRIIGGSITSAGKWPWTVALRAGNSVICGATIIDAMWVMTAGHCVQNMVPIPHAGSVIVGVGDINDVSKQIYYVTEVVLHPEYYFIYNADIALLRLHRPIEFGPKVKQICLPWDKQEFSPSSRCYIAGWGLSDMTEYHTTHAPRFLRDVKTKIMRHDLCKYKYSNKRAIKDTMICAGYAGGKKDACKGDSGGALMCDNGGNRWTAVGVISWGDKCGSTDRPGVYTRVASYVDWIDSTFKTSESSQSNVNCTFESSGWCGYTATETTGSYYWARKPGGKYISGWIMFASSSVEYKPNSRVNASLLTADFNITQNSCLIFSYLFTCNSNLTLSVHAISSQPKGQSSNTSSSLLWRMNGHYPSTDAWRKTEVDVPLGTRQLMFNSIHENGVVSDLGLDNVTLVLSACKGNDFLACDFNAGTFCNYINYVLQTGQEWGIGLKDGSKTDFAAKTGDINEQFGSSITTRLASPSLNHTFSSVEHCLHFSFKKISSSSSRLQVATYTNIGGDEFVNQVLIWSSDNHFSDTWTRVNLNIRTGFYYDNFAIEVRRDASTSLSGAVNSIMIDDVSVTNGACV